MSTLTTRTHLLAAIAQAQADGFEYFAAALAELYRRQFGCMAVLTPVQQMHADTLAECRLVARRANSPETFTEDDHVLLLRVQERNREREAEFVVIQ